MWAGVPNAVTAVFHFLTQYQSPAAQKARALETLRTQITDMETARDALLAVVAVAEEDRRRLAGVVDDLQRLRRQEARLRAGE